MGEKEGVGGNKSTRLKRSIERGRRVEGGMLMKMLMIK